MNTKVYRLSKDTNEITEISESQALKIIGYYYNKPLKELNYSTYVNTPYAYISRGAFLLYILQTNINKSTV